MTSENPPGPGVRPARARRLPAVPENRSWVRALLVAVVATAAAILYGFHLSDATLSVEMKSTTGDKGEVFFAAGKDGYSQARSLPFHIDADGQWHHYVIALPRQRIDRLRLDPGNGSGTIAVRSLELREDSHRQRFSDRRLHEALGIKHHVRIAGSDPTALTFTSIGRDPYFEIVPPDPVGVVSAAAKGLRMAAVAMIALLGWRLLEWIAARSAVFRQRRRRPGTVIARIAASLSDDEVLCVDGRMLLVVLCFVLAAVAYVSLRLNQSSIGIWETVYPAQPVEQAIDVGTPKRIRSDEWKVLTPWVLNQVLTGARLQNRDVGGESSPLLASVPVAGAIGLPQLKYAGFRFLDLDRGMSWWWAYKSFALLLSVFWLCLLLTRGNLAASLLGTTWIYMSSFTQWWFSSNLPEILTAFAIGTVGAIYALFAVRRRFILAGCALMFYAVANLALNLYPPFIVPLAYLAIAILAGLAIEKAAAGRLLHGIHFRGAALAGTIVLSAAYASAFVIAAADSIHAVVNTVYPGHRLAGSGGVPASKLLYGYFEAFRLGEDHFPLRSASSNACEASSFVLLAPLALLIVPWRMWRSRAHALPAALAVFFLVAVLWIAVSLPSPVEHLMQTFGWSAVTPKRTVLASGVTSILLCVVLFARIQDARIPVVCSDVRRMAVVAIGIGVVAFGWGLRQVDAGFFSFQVLALGITGCLLMAAGIAFGRTRLLAAGLAIYSLPLLAVNPLISGISSISQKPVLQAATRSGGSPGDRWVVIGDNFFAQGLKAHGLDVLAGTQYLPDRSSLKVLDPGNAYERIWNRYATIRVLSDPGRATPLFKQTRGDQYAMALDVCGAQLRQLGITHVAYTVQVPAEDLACLQKLPSPPDSGVQLFRLRHQRR